MPTPAPTLAPQRRAPAIGARIGMGFGSLGIPSTAKVVATQPDPAGGAPWALRTFERRAVAGQHAAVWCSQLGRIVGGRFVWIMPGAERTGPLRLSTGETTVCATSSPIAQHLGVMIASMPDRPVRDLSARIGATVLWGSIDGPVRTAQVQQGGKTIPVTSVRHGFLHVMPGSVEATLPRLEVTDRDGTRRIAIPPAYFSILTVMLGPQSIGRKIPDGFLARPGSPTRKGAGTIVDPATTKQVATYSAANDDVPQGLFAFRDGRDHHCYFEPTAAVAGRPVIADRWDGMVRQPPYQCSPMPPNAGLRPMVLRSGWSSRDIVYGKGTPAAKLAIQRRVWERIPPGSGGMLVSVPPGTSMLEVQSPVGVKTVRVDPARIAYIGWVGQPEVQRALFPMASRRKNGTYAFALRGTVLLRALDARGRQIGQTTSTAPPAASVRH